MANAMHVDIVSAESEIFSGDAVFVSVPAVEGEVGIMPRHTQMLCQMRPGEIRLKLDDGSERSFYVSGGILEVQPNLVTILSDVAMRTEDLDEAEALAAQERAKHLLADNKSDIDLARARADLAEAAAQLHAISRMRKRIGL